MGAEATLPKRNRNAWPRVSGQFSPRQSESASVGTPLAHRFLRLNQERRPLMALVMLELVAGLLPVVLLSLAVVVRP